MTRPTPISAKDKNNPQVIVRKLEKALDAHLARRQADPFANPVLALSRDVSRCLGDKRLDLKSIQKLITHVTAKNFEARAKGLQSYLGETNPRKNADILHKLFSGLAKNASFKEFQARIEQEVYGIVFTAHPTFSMNAKLYPRLAENKAVKDVSHAPDLPITLEEEHRLSMTALAHAQAALARVYDIVFDVAATHYPDQWTKLVPCLITLASWVGYDLDGRNDIQWTATLEKRLIVQQRQLETYLKAARSLKIKSLTDILKPACDLVKQDIKALSTYDGHNLKTLQRAAQHMHKTRKDRLVKTAPLIKTLDKEIKAETNAARLKKLCGLRAEIANMGLGMAHTHVRINAKQIHNAIRKKVKLQTEPDDPRFEKSYLSSITRALKSVKKENINFGSLVTERPSATRLFMIIAQMVKYMDASAPIRFLIAECDTAFTVLTALYFAKLFGVEDHIDICPLFETEEALERGSRLIEELLKNPQYRAYIQKRGCLAIQTGFSDAGRYIGQTPACGSIERLKQRTLNLFKTHPALRNVQLLVFDTHGESIGRGRHPKSFADRLAYVAPAQLLHTAATHGISYKQETSFQGGDGYVYFATAQAAQAPVTRILEYMLGNHSKAAKDPFYEEKDFITEFFTTVKTFQDQLLESPGYAALLGTWNVNMLYPSGSRAAKRQFENAQSAQAPHPSQYRAIPHNAILQQLGLLANSVGGMGAAIGHDPEKFQSLYKDSPRFRRMMGIAEYAAAVSNADVLKAYIDSLDPMLWLIRAANNKDTTRQQNMHRLADNLKEPELHRPLNAVYRELFQDLTKFGQSHAPVDRHKIYKDPKARNLAILHALRLALMHEIFLLSSRIPSYASRYTSSPKQLIRRILQLDIPEAVAELKEIFPIAEENLKALDFGEKATYSGIDSSGYRTEHKEIFDPMLTLHDQIRQISIAINHQIGFMG